MSLMENLSLIVNVVSIAVGLAGLMFAQVKIRSWVRLHRDTSGLLIMDVDGTEIDKVKLNKDGYEKHLKIAKSHIADNFSNKSFDVIASPAEVDYIFAFLLAHLLKKPFCSIHTSAQWPKSLTRYRYNKIEPGDRVILVTVIVSSGTFLVPDIEQIMATGLID